MADWSGKWVRVEYPGYHNSSGEPHPLHGRVVKAVRPIGGNNTLWIVDVGRDASTLPGVDENFRRYLHSEQDRLSLAPTEMPHNSENFRENFLSICQEILNEN